MIGIYEIRCKENDKIYIGGSIDIERRWRVHRNELRRGAHVNRHLLNAWRLYGEESFLFAVLEVCEEKDLTRREQFWLDQTDCYKVGFNIYKRAGKFDSMEERLRKAEIAKQVLTGVRKSAEHRTNISKAKRRLTDEQELEICRLYQEGMQHKLLMEKAGFSSLKAIQKLLKRRGIPPRRIYSFS